MAVVRLCRENSLLWTVNHGDGVAVECARAFRGQRGAGEKKGHFVLVLSSLPSGFIVFARADFMGSRVFLRWGDGGLREVLSL